MLKIHGVSVSPFVRKVCAVLAEKGVAYELVPVIPSNAGPEFKKLSPTGKVPVLEDGDTVVPDSSCIVAYLERRYPEPALFPADAAAYGRALFYEEYADTVIYGAMAPVFIQRVVVPRIMKGTPDEKLIQEALERAPAILDYLEGEIGDSEWLAGNQLSVADISVAAPFVNWAYAGERVDAGRWPRLAAYVERVHARPSIRALIEQERAAFGVS